MAEPLASDPIEGMSEGCVAEGELRILSYIDPDNVSRFAWTVTEGMSTSGLIGMLTMLAHHLDHKINEHEVPAEDE